MLDRPSTGDSSGLLAESRRLVARGLRLEYVTLAWNVVGAAVVLSAAAMARSVALAGFGLDSLIEIVASLVVVWQLTGADRDRERRALGVIGIAFGLLAVYIGAQSVYVLAVAARPHHSLLGIAWLAATVVAMFVLASAKASTGRALGNRVLKTEARVTLVDGLLASSVLVGLVLNASFEWWWADPLAGFVVVLYGIREALFSVRAARTP